jgi:ketosteroid isomerase-like protein
MSQSNVEIARRGFEAVMYGDLDAIGDLLDPEVKWHGGDPSAEGACHNRKEALEFMRRARRRSPMGELVDVIDAGSRVVVVIRPSRGAELRANLTTFRDGKVIEMVAYETPKDALAAAGVSESGEPDARYAGHRSSHAPTGADADDQSRA